MQLNCKSSFLTKITKNLILAQEWVDLRKKILKLLNKLTVLVLSSLSGRLRELKNKGKIQLGNPKSCRGDLQQLFITKFKSKFKRGFTKVTSAGRLREWSPGDFLLYINYTKSKVNGQIEWKNKLQWMKNGARKSLPLLPPSALG